MGNNWRQVQRQQRLEQILSTAEDLVSEAGLEALTLHSLARKLGMTPAALYRYFANKAGLFVALQMRVIAQYRADLDDVLTRVAGAPPLVAALAVPMLYAEVARVDRRRFALASDVLGNPRQLLSNADAAPLLPPLFALLQEASAPLLAASESGVLSPADPAVRATTLLSSLQGLLQLSKLTRLAPNLDPSLQVNAFLRALFIGWGAEAQAVDDALAHLQTLAPLVHQETP